MGAARLRELLSHTLRMSHALEPAESRLSAPAWTLLGRDPRAAPAAAVVGAVDVDSTHAARGRAVPRARGARGDVAVVGARAASALPPSRDVEVRGSISAATHMHVLAARELGRRLPQTLTAAHSTSPACAAT